MALAKTNITEYIAGADFDPDFETLREAAMDVLTGTESVGELAIPAALAAAVGTTADTMALLGVMAAGINDETVPLGVKVYTALVVGTPKIFARNTGS